MTAPIHRVRDYWHEDSASYDDAVSHNPRSPAVRAAWAASLRHLLPPPPARVLDVGAGTGFLSLLLAGQGYRVTALDLAAGMLDRLRAKAATAAVEIDTVEGDAAHPPPGEFDAVVERHLVWTLPEPEATLEAWHQVAPGGRLILLESIWGAAADAEPGERARQRGRAVLHRLMRRPDDHHAEYGQDLIASLPLGRGTRPDDVVALVAATSWGQPRLERLVDVEWATRRSLSTVPDRLLGVAPRFAVSAG